MENTPYFTIIMPVYNGERYLERAINSILNQTFDDFELVIVDDGSTDSSYSIIQKIMMKDKRVILKKTPNNMGVAAARNEGLKWIRGQYLNFVDADDYLDKDILEVVYRRLSKSPVQILKYGCIEEYYDKDDILIGKKEIHLQERFITQGNEVKRNIIEMEKLPLFGYLWNTFYQVSFFQLGNFLFNTCFKVNEDFIFNMEVFDQVDSLICLGFCGYHYAKRIENSLSTRKNNQYYELHIAKIQKLLEMYGKWRLLDKDIERDIYWLYTRCVYSSICRKIKNDGLLAGKRELERITTSSLFYQFTCVKFCHKHIKETLMMRVLQCKSSFQILLLCEMINLIQSRFRVVFAKIKE